MDIIFSEKLREISDYRKGVDRVTDISLLIISNNEYRDVGKRCMDQILSLMIRASASDLDFGGVGTDEKIWMRVHGRKTRFDKLCTISKDEATAIICSILPDKCIKELLNNQSCDFSYEIETDGKSLRFRASAYMDMDFLAANFRLVNCTTIPIESLGFPPPIIRKFDLDYEKRGLILVTGLTGSGKSTTLDAIVNMNNCKNDAHILIIGKPIEYFHKSNKSIVRHREVGRDTLSFKHGAIESLRQDPDIIVIGEMRDPNTIMTALEITDSGHKVLSTLHTGSAVESIHRIVAECPHDEQNRVRLRLSDVLSVVVSQKLIPSLDGKRILAKEILNVTPNVAAAISNNNIKEIYQMITEGKDYGMITMEQDLMRLYMSKQISKKNAIAFANNKKRMIDLVQYYHNNMA